MKKITIGDLKKSIGIIDDDAPVVLFNNGFKVNIELTVSDGALIISASDMPKPSVKYAIEWDGHYDVQCSCGCEKNVDDDD